MNATVLEFLQKHQIPSPDSAKGINFSIKSADQVNHVVNNNKLSLAEDARTKVSVANIVGYDYRYMDLVSYNFLENLSHFYDAHGTGYQTRSISMLEYSTEEIMDKLTPSFSKEPIRVIEAEKGIYTIGENGLHRYHVLRAHYMKELARLNPNDTEAIAKLNEKYTIDAIVTQPDYACTYFAYFIKRIALAIGLENIDFSVEYDQDFNKTGNIVAVSDQDPDQTYTYTQPQLQKLFKDALDDYFETFADNPAKLQSLYDTIQHMYETLPSFQEFYTTHMHPYMQENHIDVFNQMQNGGSLCK